MFVDVNGTRLHAVSFGTGDRTLVAVGGWTGSWELWAHPFELLTTNGWRCIAYDHRGSGESPSDDISVEALVADVFGVLDAFGIERCVLAGESMGGAVALLAAEQAPERFDGLVLVACANTVASEGRARLAAGSRADYPATVQAFIEACVPEPDVEHIKRWGRNVLLRADPEHAAQLLEMWEGGPYGDPSRVTVPSLLIHGTLDVISPLSYGQSLADTIPEAELLVLDGIGHVPTMIRPHDVVAAIERRYPKP